MLPKWHILFGALVSIILYLFFNLTLYQTLIVFLSSIVVDFDHYLYYIFKYKKIGIREAYNCFSKKREKWISLKPEEREKYKRYIFIFHGVEFWIILIFFFFINKFFLWILIGITLHMILDFTEIFYNKEPFYTKFSQILVFIKNKNVYIISI